MLKNIILKSFKSKLLVRHDPDGTIVYLTPEQVGITGRAFDFLADHGGLLKGYFYTKGTPRADKLIVFDHGMGCGHKAYMREIATICEHGYEVFAYDHTGTLESAGDSIGGFTQSLVDLDLAISAIKDKGEARGRKIAVIGHSWGGFSTLNIAAYHPDITHVVPLSGFISAREMISCLLGKLQKYSPMLFALEEERFGSYAYSDARLSLKLAKNTKALVIHSKDDMTCPYTHLEKLRAAIGDGGNVTYLTVNGKNHNPNFTCEAAAYKDRFFAELTHLKKKKKLTTSESKDAFVARWDFIKMTEQDMALWQTIFNFLEQ